RISTLIRIVSVATRMIRRQDPGRRKRSEMMYALSTIRPTWRLGRTVNPAFPTGTRLETIFEPSKFPKNCGEGVADHAEPLLDLRTVRAQERILGKFGCKANGQSCPTFVTQSLDFFCPLPKGRIVRLDGEREGCVGLGIFMATINERFLRQGH